MNAMRPAGTLPALLLIAALCMVPVAAGPGGGLSGTVRDSVGRVLEGVDVVVLAGSQISPVAVLRSDGEGRFSSPRLVPGAYRVTAFKEGYAAFVGPVDTLVKDSIELILHPMPSGAARAAAVPRDASWMLRVPRRSILREVRPVAAAAEEADPEHDPSAQALVQDLSLTLEQLFSVSLRPVDSDVRGGELEATETRLLLSSSIGAGTSVQVRGRRDDLGSSGGATEEPAVARERALGLGVDLLQETGSSSRFALTTSYFSRARELATARPGGLDPLLHDVRSWGYDAGWTVEPDDASRFEVGIDLADTLVDRAEGAGPASRFGSRELGVSGSYRRVHRAGHATEVALRAGHQTWPTPIGASPFFTVDPGGTGWNVELLALDRWNVSGVGPLAVTYGFGYLQTFDDGDFALVAPRLGGSWSSDRATLRASASYHAVAGRRPPSLAAGSAGHRTRETLGWEAGLKLSVADGLSFEGGVSYSPWQYELRGLDDGAGPLELPPTFLTDGDASLRENRFGVVADRRNARAYLELSDGHAEGRLVPLLPFEIGTWTVAQSALEVRSARCGLTIKGYGTDLVLDYAKVESQSPGDAGQADHAREETIELRMQQDLRGLQRRVDLRFLAALRLASIETASLDEWQQGGGDPAPLEALNRRLTAGLSVMF